jgi:hypothetical protein
MKASLDLSSAGRTAGCWLALAMLLGAGADGYPTEDAPRFDPSTLSQAELLEGLNALGADPLLDKRWRYSLEPGCQLRISVRKGQPPERWWVLEGSTVDVRSEDGRTEVLLLPPSGDESAAVVAIETRRWTDTVSARLLLTHLEMSCGQHTGTAS